MTLYLAFNGEGSTDNRFITILIERIIQDFFLSRNITVEFSWMIIPKKGSSFENILKVCEDSKEQNCVFIHRDADNNTWIQAYNNHFNQAITQISEDEEEKYNKNVVPIIPVKETEAWMLVNKDTLKSEIGTTLSNNALGLTYLQSRIENIRDPKRKIESAISIYKKSLNPKQLRYAVNIEDLYDVMATEIQLDDLENLDSYNRFKNDLTELLNSFIE